MNTNQQLLAEPQLIFYDVKNHIENILGTEIQPTMICIVGSRIVGNCREDSDLDIAIQYKGDIREDDVFNELMVEPLYIYNFKVDFIPIVRLRGILSP